MAIILMINGKQFPDKLTGLNEQKVKDKLYKKYSPDTWIQMFVGEVKAFRDKLVPDDECALQDLFNEPKKT